MHQNEVFRRQVIKWAKLIVLFFIIILLATFSFWYRNYAAEELDTSKLVGIFSQKDGEVYASVPSSGLYRLPGADAQQFRLLDGGLANKHIGRDDKQVYCGNQAIPHFNPASTKALGNHYYTDGKNTCYCGPITEPANQNKFRLIHDILYGLGIGERPQLDWYPVYILNADKGPYQALANIPEGATNGTYSYIAGKELKDANSQLLHPITEKLSDGQSQASNWYFSDGQHVYYKDKVLDIKAQPNLYSFHSELPQGQDYLLDPQNGQVYVNDRAFPKKYAPYQLLSLHEKHLQHTLFTSKYGLFYYDANKDKIERIKDNPFASGQFKEIAPLVFSDGKQLLFSETLQLNNSTLYVLSESTTGGWEKIGPAIQQLGSLWKNGKQYYFFSNVHPDLGMKEKIRRIVDPKTILQLQEPCDYPIANQQWGQNLGLNGSNSEVYPHQAIQEKSHPDLVKLLKSDLLASVDKKELIKIQSEYKPVGESLSNWYFFFLFLLPVFIALFVRTYNKKHKIDPRPFRIENQQLIIHGLLQRAYDLDQIVEVVFSFKADRSYLNTFSGTLRVFTKDGKRSSAFQFQRKNKMRGEFKEDMTAYIEGLQRLLRKHQIASRIED